MACDVCDEPVNPGGASEQAAAVLLRAVIYDSIFWGDYIWDGMCILWYL